MAKRASLEPKPTTKAHAPWVVNLPPLLSSTRSENADTSTQRKRLRPSVHQQRIRLENYGTASTTLPAGKIEEAAAAYERLRGTGIGLLEAVEQVLHWQRDRENSVTFKTMFESLTMRQTSKSPHDELSASPQPLVAGADDSRVCTPVPRL